MAEPVTRHFSTAHDRFVRIESDRGGKLEARGNINSLLAALEISDTSCIFADRRGALAADDYSRDQGFAGACDLADIGRDVLGREAVWP